MKMVNQAGVGASLAACVGFDDFTTVGRGIGLCPSVNRASELKRDGTLAWLPVPQPRNCHAGTHKYRSHSSVRTFRRLETKETYWHL
jgi:hypothetical protein